VRTTCSGKKGTGTHLQADLRRGYFRPGEGHPRTTALPALVQDSSDSDSPPAPFPTRHPEAGAGGDGGQGEGRPPAPNQPAARAFHPPPAAGPQGGTAPPGNTSGGKHSRPVRARGGGGPPGSVTSGRGGPASFPLVTSPPRLTGPPRWEGERRERAPGRRYGHGGRTHLSSSPGFWLLPRTLLRRQRQPEGTVTGGGGRRDRAPRRAATRTRTPRRRSVCRSVAHSPPPESTRFSKWRVLGRGEGSGKAAANQRPQPGRRREAVAGEGEGARAGRGGRCCGGACWRCVAPAGAACGDVRPRGGGRAVCASAYAEAWSGEVGGAFHRPAPPPFPPPAVCRLVAVRPSWVRAPFPFRALLWPRLLRSSAWAGGAWRSLLTVTAASSPRLRGRGRRRGSRGWGARAAPRPGKTWASRAGPARAKARSRRPCCGAIRRAGRRDGGAPSAGSDTGGARRTRRRRRRRRRREQAGVARASDRAEAAPCWQ